MQPSINVTIAGIQKIQHATAEKAKLLSTKISETSTVGLSTFNKHLTRTSHPANHSINIHHHKAVPDTMMCKKTTRQKSATPISTQPNISTYFEPTEGTTIQLSTTTKLQIARISDQWVKLFARLFSEQAT